MTKTTRQYPPDEFDEVSPDAAPAGVHRAPRGAWSKVAPFLAVLVICSLLAVVAVLYYTRTQEPPTAQTPTTSAAPDDGTGETPAEGETPPEGEVPADDGTVEDPAVEEPVEPVVEADVTTAVRVLNGTGRAGVAATAAESLGAVGWVDVTADNYTGADLDASVVYYKTPDDIEEGQAVAAVLGIDQVIEVPALVGPVSAVLVGDYPN